MLFLKHLTSAGLVAISTLGLTSLTWAQGGAGDFIHACVNPNSGEIKIVTPSVGCRPGETRLLWSPAPVTGISGPPVRFLALLAGSDFVEPSSETFEDVPGLTANFETSADGCVTATLSVSSGYFIARILIDAQLMEGHGSWQVGADELLFATGDAVSYTVWKCGVARGLHTISVQWKGGPMLGGRTLVVLGP